MVLVGRERRVAGLTAAACAAGLVASAAVAGAEAPISHMPEIGSAFSACWSPPPGLAKLESLKTTVRFSLKRTGELLGEPRVTFSSASIDTHARSVLTEAILAAVRKCTPLAITDSLGQAIVGRPITVRSFIMDPKESDL